MFPTCSITIEVKSFTGILQRICQDFKTKKQEILNTHITKRIDVCFTSPAKLLTLSLKCVFFSDPGRLCNKLRYYQLTILQITNFYLPFFENFSTKVDLLTLKVFQICPEDMYVF